jgi:hypothetical protein
LTDIIHEEKLKELLNEGNYWRTEGFSKILGVSTSSKKTVLKMVGAKKVASRWVPHRLKQEQKEFCVNISAGHLERFNNNPDILERTIAIDETGLKSHDP